MDPTRTNYRSRAEINDNKKEYNNSPSPSPYDNGSVKLNPALQPAYNEPIPQSRLKLNNTMKDNTESTSPQS